LARRFVTVDVFTDRALAGNQLAIVLDSDGLNAAAMQRIACEFNLSETVFVLPPENPAHAARLRIFTPLREVPFAGHPTIGTAVILARQGASDDEERDELVALEQTVGLVRVGVVLKKDSAAFAEFDAPRLPQESELPADQNMIARAIGVMETEIGFANHKPTAFDAGLPYVFIPVRDRGTLAGALPSPELWRVVFGHEADCAAYVYTRATDGDFDYEARMFDPDAGIPEDPATGSAVAGFAGVVGRFDALADGRHELKIAQGRDMGRPSLIRLEVELNAGRLHAVRIGGAVVPVSTGEISV